MKGIVPAILVFLLMAARDVQAQYAYTTNADNTLTITGYRGTPGAVTIPSEINGLVVVRIESGAFDPFLGRTRSLNCFSARALVANCKMTMGWTPGALPRSLESEPNFSTSSIQSSRATRIPRNGENASGHRAS